MDIKKLREDINLIDKEMASLFEKRMGLAKLIAEFKRENGLPIYDKTREQAVIENNLAFIKDENIKDYYVSFIKSVMDESKKYQHTLLKGMRVGYCGIPGAFGYMAAKKMYPDAEYVSYKSFQNAYEACENGEIELVILPLENSYVGEVSSVMDLAFNGSLYINRIEEIVINQNLLGVKGSKKEDIKTVISHPQALEQCEEYIVKNGLNKLERTNTAVAAKEAAEKNDKSLGAIASEETAMIYNLDILDANINSSVTNVTRFATFSRIKRLPEKNKDKMGEHFILFYTVKNNAGALAKTLSIIGKHGFNMRSVKSRPNKKINWNYYFFVEVEGNINTKEGESLLNELKDVCDELKLGGAYTL